ncbi:MAG: protoporphyrinogen oxidase [Elusimicrobiota bacterium]
MIVAGAGMAGLSCAYELLKAKDAPEVTLLESSSRAGGKVLSESEGGVVFEAGPDSFITQKPWALELIRELGLEGRLLPTDRVRKDVHVFSRGRLRKYPEGLMLMAPTKVWPFLLCDLLPLKDKLRMGLEPLCPPPPPDQDESLAAFTRRRFGEAALRVIVGPILAGIFAGDPEELSLKSTFPQFLELEKKHGSVLLGMRAAARRRSQGAAAPSASGLEPGKAAGAAKRPRGDLTLFMALRGGLGELVDALLVRVGGVLRTGAGVRSIRRQGALWRVELSSGEVQESDALVLAMPADSAALALREVDPVLAGLAGAIPFTSTATVSLLYPAKDFPHPLDGFGFVVERSEPTTVLAATYTSTKFPGRVPKDKVLIRCFLGGAGREETLKKDDAGLVAAVREDLSRIMGFDLEPEKAKVYRWEKANPQFIVGHGERLVRMEERLAAQPGLILAGGSYRGVGVPECVRSGREAARLILAAGSVPPAGTVI